MSRRVSVIAFGWGIVLALLGVGLVPTAGLAAQRNAPQPTSLASTAAEAVNRLGLFSWLTGNGPVTREEAVRAVAQVIGVSPSTSSSSAYQDVTATTASGYIGWIAASAAAGLLAGWAPSPGGEPACSQPCDFSPTAPMTREELAVLASDALHLQGDMSGPGPQPLQWYDARSVADETDMWTAAKDGIVPPLNASTFGGIKDVTPAMLRVTVYRMWRAWDVPLPPNVLLNPANARVEAGRPESLSIASGVTASTGDGPVVTSLRSCSVVLLPSYSQGSNCPLIAEDNLATYASAYQVLGPYSAAKAATFAAGTPMPPANDVSSSGSVTGNEFAASAPGVYVILLTLTGVGLPVQATTASAVATVTVVAPPPDLPPTPVTGATLTPGNGGSPAGGFIQVSGVSLGTGARATITLSSPQIGDAVLWTDLGRTDGFLYGPNFTSATTLAQAINTFDSAVTASGDNPTGVVTVQCNTTGAGGCGQISIGTTDTPRIGVTQFSGGTDADTVRVGPVTFVAGATGPYGYTDGAGLSAAIQAASAQTGATTQYLSGTGTIMLTATQAGIAGNAITLSAASSNPSNYAVTPFSGGSDATYGSLQLTFAQAVNPNTLTSTNLTSVLTPSGAHSFGTAPTGSWNTGDTVFTITLGAGATVRAGDTIAVNPSVKAQSGASIASPTPAVILYIT